MIPALLTRFFGAQALKAVVGGFVTSGTAGLLTDGFTKGFVEGFGPAAHEIGLQLGMFLGTFLIGHVFVYVFPNKPDPKKD